MLQNFKATLRGKKKINKQVKKTRKSISHFFLSFSSFGVERKKKEGNSNGGLVYLMTTLIDEVRVSRPGLGDASVLLLSISLDRAGSQDIILLCSSHGYSLLRTPPIHVPQLSNGVCSALLSSLGHLVLVIKPFGVVAWPHLYLVVLEERVIESRLMRDGYAVNDIPIWALFIIIII